MMWIPSSNGALVENAVIGGVSKTGETLFIGRFPWSANKVLKNKEPGKIVPSAKKCFIEFGSAVHESDTYDILIGLVRVTVWFFYKRKVYRFLPMFDL